MFRHLDLFSGIGGFALASEMVWPHVEHEFVEIDPFCQSILKKHWPKSHIHGDIKTYRGGSEPVDLITGGFPCQPFSNAGQRKGTEDDRHLWPEMLRVIREVRPRWVIGENVDGIFTWNDGLVFEQVLASMESAGYEVQPYRIPASAVGAHHRRDRYWFLAHSHSARQSQSQRVECQQWGRFSYGSPHVADPHKVRRGGWRVEELEAETEERRKGSTRSSERCEDVAHAPSKGLPQRRQSRQQADETETATGPDDRSERHGENVPDSDSLNAQRGDNKTTKRRAKSSERSAGLPDSVGGRPAQWPAEPRLGRVAHGIPNRVDRIKSLGNAIVPQVAAEIMRAIKYADQ